MTELKMPLSKVYELFTRSELAMMSWASQEQFSDLEKIKKPKRKRQVTQKFESPERRLAKEFNGDEEQIVEQDNPRLEGLPSRYYNEDGELDLRRVTGAEAVRLMGKMGIHVLPIIKR